MARIDGQWSPCKQIYSKVDGEWKIVYDLTLEDDFDGSGNLEITPGSVPWEQISGTWTKGGGNVSTGSQVNVVAAIETGTPDIEIEIDTASTSQGGPGVAFWIQDQLTWWGVRFYTEQFTSSTPGSVFAYFVNCTGVPYVRFGGNIRTAQLYTCTVFESRSRGVNGGCPVTSCPTCVNVIYSVLSNSNTCGNVTLGNNTVFNNFLTANCNCFCNRSVSVGPPTNFVAATYNCGNVSTFSPTSTFTFSPIAPVPLAPCDTSVANNSSVGAEYSCISQYTVISSNPPTFFTGVHKRGQLVRSFQGSVATIKSQDFGDTGNIYVKTYGNVVDFRQYSAARKQGNASGVISFDAGGNFPKTTKHGMVITSVPFAQNYSISRFKVNL
jgi:hypothetical protein